MIKSFQNQMADDLFHRRRNKSFPPDLRRKGEIKMRVLDRAISLTDLEAPPGNRLELLKGNRAGQYSVRINDQWRICFRWKEGHAHDVEVVDYH